MDPPPLVVPSPEIRRRERCDGRPGGRLGGRLGKPTRHDGLARLGLRPRQDGHAWIQRQPAVRPQWRVQGILHEPAQGSPRHVSVALLVATHSQVPTTVGRTGAADSRRLVLTPRPGSTRGAGPADAAAATLTRVSGTFTTSVASAYPHDVLKGRTRGVRRQSWMGDSVADRLRRVSVECNVLERLSLDEDGVRRMVSGRGVESRRASTIHPVGLDRRS